MDSELPPTSQHGSGPTRAEAQPGSFPADIFDNLLATAGRASPLTQFFLFISQMLGLRLGLDLSVIMALLGVFWVTIKIGGQAYTLVNAFIENHLMHSVTVPHDDEIYTHVMAWLSKQERVIKSSCLVAKTVGVDDCDDDDDDEEEDLENTLDFTDDGDENPGQQHLNVLKLISRVRHQYFPAIGKTRFWHKNRYFVVRRSKIVVMTTSPLPSEMKMEEIKISCLWSSREPIDKLLLEAKEMLWTNPTRPSSWRLAARRPKRSKETVILPGAITDFLIPDIREFLMTTTERWYTARDIPWRRGYLFFGPPGTGKTSFVTAIAAYFLLDIYTINLSEPNMTDANLLRLFRDLPRRCMVLIEDIDVSGIQRDTDSKAVERNRGTTNRMAMITESFSFGGLLNAIDGVAAQEGRILIMTTNKPESLDEALIRPGRVDVKVEFHNATKQQSAALFRRMYGDSTPLKPNKPASKGIKDQNNDKVSVSQEEIKSLSEEFSEKIPDRLCSPAEIQEFMLLRKEDPRKAVDEVESWVEKMKEQKNSGSN
ncbi:mitochondrial chaperone BCS1, partial [Metarhizium majus ARSEF 297]